MTLGPVQLLIIGFEDPQIHGEIRAALDTLAQQVPPPPTATTWERRSRSQSTGSR